MHNIPRILAIVMITASCSSNSSPVEVGDHFGCGTKDCDPDYTVGPVKEVRGDWAKVCQPEDETKCGWVNVVACTGYHIAGSGPIITICPK